MNQELNQLFEHYKKLKTEELNKYYGDLIKSLGEDNVQSNFHILNTKLVEKVKQLTLPGKNIRGLLFIIGYELCGQKASPQVYKASLLLELFHAGVLMHDDIMDKDELRRGITTVHVDFREYAREHLLNDPTDYGTNMGINAGDLNILYGLGLFADTAENSVNALKALKLYSYYTSRVVLGQVLDVSNFGENISSEYVERIHQYKTAEYTGVMPLLMGATYGGITDETTLNALEKFGLSLGWAFQVKDDILGTFSTTDQTGKPNDSDITEGKNTILVSETLKRASELDKLTFAKIYGKPNMNNEEIDAVSEIFVKYDIENVCNEIGYDYISHAKQLIPEITNDDQKQKLLREMADFFMSRKS